jgi:membrane-associated phospholipid phosphatase
MYKALLVCMIAWLFFCLAAKGQEKDTLVNKLDSLSRLPDSVDVSAENYNELTKITGRTYLVLLGNNFKQQVTAPFHLKGKDWVKLGGFALLTGSAMLADKSIQRYATDLSERNPFIKEVGSHVTNFGATYEVYTLAALAGYGFIFKNEKIKTTTYLATQAYLTSYVMFNLIKFMAGQQRPNYVDPQTNSVSPRFHGPLHRFKKDAAGNKPPDNSYTSFPSGHATLAFAAATVYAMEYRDRPLVPIIAYSAASLVGLTRITENKHWASNILVGAALGHLCGRQVVNNYHRYARLKNAGKKPNPVTFNVQLINGLPIPGIVYRFN